MHSFRIREQLPSQTRRASMSEKRPPSVDGFVYGFSHFNQRKDASSKRGYEQVISDDLPIYCV